MPSGPDGRRRSRGPRSPDSGPSRSASSCRSATRPPNVRAVARGDRAAPAPPLAPFEVVYVDDGSTDATPARARRSPRRAAPGCACSGTPKAAARAPPSAAACWPPARRSRRPSTATGRTTRPSSRSSSRRSRPAGRASALAAGQRVGAQGERRSSASSRGSPTASARRILQGRHPRHRLRPQGVPARGLPGAALFRRPPPLHAGPRRPRGLGRRPCRRGRPAAPRRAAPITASSTGSGSASWTSPASGGCIRRRRRVPQVEEVA